VAHLLLNHNITKKPAGIISAGEHIIAKSLEDVGISRLLEIRRAP
jgi:hypothetical protein